MGLKHQGPFLSLSRVVGDSKTIGGSFSPSLPGMVHQSPAYFLQQIPASPLSMNGVPETVAVVCFIFNFSIATVKIHA